MSIVLVVLPTCLFTMSLPSASYVLDLTAALLDVFDTACAAITVGTTLSLNTINAIPADVVGRVTCYAYHLGSK